MPQLDKVTFLSQFFWLCFFYLGFYIVLYKYFLPKMSRVLKLRQKKIDNSQQGITNMLQENEKVRGLYDVMFLKALSTSRKMFNDNFTRTQVWSNNTVTNANKTHYQNINRAYIQSVGENSLSENYALSQGNIELPEKLLYLLLTKKIKSRPVKKHNVKTLSVSKPTLKSTSKTTSDSETIQKKSRKKTT